MTSTLENVQALAPEINERAEEIERARAMPRDLVEKLRTAGVFRMYVPVSHGGDEMWPLEGIKVIEELARADGSVGWISAVGAEAPRFFAYLPSETFDKIYSSGPDVIHAGSLLPRGRAVSERDGYKFTGRWSFTSGCTHADFIGLNAMTEDGSVHEGRPDARYAAVPASAVEIIDTWHVNGLKGTGSNDVAVNDLFVPAEWTGSFTDGPPVVRQPLDGRSTLARFGLEFAAVSVGIAQGALDDIIAIAREKRPLAGLQGRLGADPVLQHTVGGFAADLQMARALLQDIARREEEYVEDDREPEDEETHLRHALLARVGSVSASVVDACYLASGTTGLFETSPLQRRLRDVMAVTQHFLLSERNAFLPAGAGVLGEPVANR